MQPQYIVLPKKAKDITGQIFERLTVLGPVGKSSNRQILWLCHCICGKQTVTTRGNLIYGHTKSCGCKNIDAIIKRSKTHGMSKSPLYKTWNRIIERCTNSNHEHFSYYGGRGIKVHETWLTAFQMFYNHVSKLPYFERNGYTLDRINNDGDYEPGNVRWATKNQQARNKRTNHIYTYKGKSQCLATWAEEYNLTYPTLKGRLKLGWNIHDALTKPANVRGGRRL